MCSSVIIPVLVTVGFVILALLYLVAWLVATALMQGDRPFAPITRPMPRPRPDDPNAAEW